MGRLILHIVFLLTVVASSAQDTSFRSPATTITADFSNLFVDNAGNIYVVNNRSQLKKLSAAGDSIAVYNDVKRFGNITSVDVVNPFKILVFYAESASIVILDRFLSARSVVDLKKTNSQSAKAVCLSYDNNIWLYDESNGKIRKLDDNGNILFESTDLRNALNVAPSFQHIVDDNRSLYLYDPSLGWYVFDYYGALSKKYPFVHWKDVQVINGKMMGRADTLFMFATKGDFDYKTVRRSFPVKGALKTIYNNKRWYILFPGKIEIYDAP
jgi:streptogramin lyase